MLSTDDNSSAKPAKQSPHNARPGRELTLMASDLLSATEPLPSVVFGPSMSWTILLL